jgi:crotonobetainyl-CoA:carnitine CoA-transferase CaiB-like acyl-CoA transferase
VPSNAPNGRRKTVKQGPLSGIRLLDLGWYGVDPEATRILSWFGAEVIRVEHESKLDYIRLNPPFAEHGKSIDYASVTDALEANAYNNSGLYNNFNPGKLCVRLNASQPEGRALLEELITISDVVTENFSYSVMEKWGLDYDALKRIRPDIIYVSMAGMGHTGPYRHVKTVGPVVQALSGVTFMGGLPGREPSGWGFSYMDHQGAYHNALAVQLAVYHRNRTGQGQYIDASTTEIGAGLTGPKTLDYTVNERRSRRPGYPMGNRLEYQAAAPHGVYRCCGDDRWIAIAVFNDDEWESLVGAMGRPDWAMEPRFATLRQRVQHQDDLDALMNGWTQDHDDVELMHRLQEAGVRAGAVLKGKDVEEDPQMRHRELFPVLDHTLIGSWPFEGIPAKLSETPGGWEWGAPMLGEDNDYMYRQVLGIAADRLERLVETGIV